MRHIYIVIDDIYSKLPTRMPNQSTFYNLRTYLLVRKRWHEIVGIVLPLKLYWSGLTGNTTTEFRLCHA